MNALVPLVGFAFQGIVLSWIRKLEKTCNCSKDWRRDYIKLVSILGVIAGLVILFRQTIPAQAALVLGVMGLVNIAAVLTYIPSLKKKACVCAIEDDWRDNFIFWWVAFGVVAMFLSTGVVIATRRS